MTVRELRTQTKLTQHEFCELTHIPLRTLQGWEAGERMPSPWVIELLEFRLSATVKVDSFIKPTVDLRRLASLDSNYTVANHFPVSAMFEISIDTAGLRYVVIYGQHVNGYYCCIPNWNCGCEMAEPSCISYNAGKLMNTGAMRDEDAEAIARAICQYYFEWEKERSKAKAEATGNT